MLVDAHVRKANPRRPEDLDRRIFRRGYPLIAGNTGGFDRGLLVVCFGRSLSTQFEFTSRAWMPNANFPTENAGVDRLFTFENQVPRRRVLLRAPARAPQRALKVVLPA